MIKHFIYTLLILSLSINSLAQNNYPQNYFRAPLDIPLVLAGTFGELRANHFHSGIDIKTQGVEGQKVYAVTDGYISRINVSPFGYGNAIYITHPNGYVSVYGHLQRFNDSIAAIIKWVQYQRKSFALEYYPDKTSLRVKKGDIIAYSGNSGSSGGPHLHFEIRKASNSHPLNPLLFGIKISDHQYPQISRLAVYNYYSAFYQERSEYRLKQNKGKVTIPNLDTVLVGNDFYIGVESIDRLDGANNKNGLYQLQYFMDSTLFFSFKVDELSFSEKRYINSYIDYQAYKTEKIKYQRTFVQPNNRLSNISNVLNRGIIHLTDNKAHQIKIIARDFAGQATILQFYVIKNPKQKTFLKSENRVFKWNENNSYQDKDAGLSFNMPKAALYDDILFTVKKLKNPYSPYSILFSIYKETVPLQKYCSISIKADSALTPDLYSKACILSLTNRNGFYYEGGSYKNGFVSTKTRSFGQYFIGVDTIAPTIKNINAYNGKNITKQQRISFKVTDDLSGINSYNAYLDGKWILLQYDPKKNKLYYTIDNHFPKGKHQLKLVVIDAKGNRSIIKMNLIRN